jgi:sugar phosphate isomerase/epimerase
VTIPVVFSTGSLHPYGLDRVYAMAAEAVYDGVEIMMDDRWDTHQADYLNGLAERHGIPIRALHPPLFRGAWDLDPEETLVRVAKLAPKVGANVVVAHPPADGVKLAAWSETTLADAREAGVTVAVENMARDRVQNFIFGWDRQYCYRPESLLSLGEVTIDTSHLAASGVGILYALEILEGQVRHVHLSDSKLTGRDEHRVPGKGKLPLKAFLAALARSEYPGVVSLELKPWPLGVPKTETVLERMREALEFTREGLEAGC